MNAATEFDLGPLTWVKGEIDLALDRAGEALARYIEQADITQLKFCRTHVHQVHGALQIVGLDGVTQVTEALERLLQAIEEGKAALGNPAAIQQSLAGLHSYLDELMAGEPNQPLRLLQTYRALVEANGGAAHFHASDLFFPDLAQRPPRRVVPPSAKTPEQRVHALKSERMRYQKGLLSWLKKPNEAEAGRRLMREAVAAIESLQEAQAARSFWWAATAFFDGLAHPSVAADPSARQLCSLIDAQIRRLLDGAGNVAERVFREVLYFVAQVPASLGPDIGAVQSTFGLKALLPGLAQDAGPQPQDAVVRRLRDVLAQTEESWNKYCTGNTASLQSFVEHARSCAQITGEIAQTDLKRLGQGLASVANWLAEDAARFSDAVAMEVATSILLLQNAQEGFKRLGTDFAQQVDLMVARLHACIAGKPIGVDQDIPLLDEMTRRAQEKLLIGQVGHEIQNNLAHIEQTLDAFFRDPGKGHDLKTLDGPIKQVSGALAMLGHFPAVNSLKDCAVQISQFASPEYQSNSADFDLVANQLSMLGFFVDALQNGETDFDAFVRRMRGELESAPVEAELPAEPSVEAQLVQHARETQALAQALKEAPEDERLKDELKQNLQAIQKDADLVANRELGESAKVALAALQSDGAAAGDVGAALSGIKTTVAEAPQPSAQTVQLAEASHDEIDAEILGIFLEEAAEVLDTLATQLAELTANPASTEALTVIRRSTHTLKGSGRMVGLTDFGETAWELEQTLNLWLRQEQSVNAELMRLVTDEHAIFCRWVAHLETGQGQVPDATELVALARRLRGVEPVAALAAAPLPPVVVAPPAPPPPEPVVAIEPEAPPVELLLPEVEPDAAAIESVEIQGIEEQSVVSEIEIPELIESSLEPSTEADGELVAAAEALEDLLVQEPLETAEPIGEPAPAPRIPTLYDIFCEEARGHLQTLVDGYAALNLNPLSPTTFEITRAAHTLGGIAATVGLMPLNRLAISLEHALLRRDGSGQPDSIEGLETVRHAIITLEEMFAGLALQQAPQEAAQLIEALGEIFPPPVAEPKEQPTAEIIQLRAAPDTPSPVAEVATVPVVEAPVAPPRPLLKDEIDEQLLPIFLEEAGDQLSNLTVQLRAWRSDLAGSAAPRAIARILHTFKGNARMAGAMNLGEVTHQLESRVEEVAKAGSANAAFLDDIESGCDALASAVEVLRAGPQPLEPAVAASAETESVAEIHPVDAGAGSIQATEHEAEVDAVSQTASLRVRADLVDRLVNEAGELSIARARIEGEMRSLKSSLLDLTDNVIRLRRQLREIEIQAESQISARTAQTPEGQAEFDPLELDRFTRFQELTRFMAESVNDVATVQQNLLKNLDDANAAILAQSRLNRGLQQALMSVRMVPFESQSERLYRIVRQTAKDVGKRANLEVLGGQVEIDRSVLDKMLGPIEHMLRNAVTHGVESREQRQASGKRETGEITLALAQEGNEIILSMTDDGKGLDVARIRTRAEAMGLLKPGEPAEDSTLFDFIFRPGFSTATELTQVSGRGVGMDVVKTEVSALGGRIETSSTLGAGTNFRLYLPLTLAVTQTLLVRSGAQLYAVPSNMIEQVLELREKPLATIKQNGEATWMENRYPFHYLSHLLGDSHAVAEARRRYWVLLLRSGTQRVAVQVDELKGNQEVVVKNIGAQLSRVVGIAGATVLGDGQVVLILNPVALASRPAPVTSEQPEAVPAQVAAYAEPPVEDHLPKVMVVDDSLTVRKITGRLLEREGYQVVLAKDGVDALEQLLEVKPAVILSDVEMPRMDGFDLLRNIRGDQRLCGIPVVMITSRTADKHRNYAMEIGANDYLGKPYDEDTLLALVAGYTGRSKLH